jgi:hypothetical protein
MASPQRRVSEAHLTEPVDHPHYTVSFWALTYAVVAGPFIWAVHLSAVSALAPWQCQEGVTWPINLVSILLIAAGLGSMAVAWSIHRRARRAPATPRSRAVAFIALVGFLWGTISLIATVMEGFPNVVGVASCPR